MIRVGEIFVFGSNLAGRHGAGAARQAYVEFGAKMGQGVGHIGASYAIPTKDEQIRTMHLHQIEPYVEEFIDYAKAHPELKFFLTPIGCGLAGYRREQIRPMFKDAPDNVRFAETWEERD